MMVPYHEKKSAISFKCYSSTSKTCLVSSDKLRGPSVSECKSFTFLVHSGLQIVLAMSISLR